MATLVVLFAPKVINYSGNADFIYIIGRQPNSIESSAKILNNPRLLSEIAVSNRDEFLQIVDALQYKAKRQVNGLSQKMPLALNFETESLRTEYSCTFRIFANLKLIEQLAPVYNITDVALSGATFPITSAFQGYLTNLNVSNTDGFLIKLTERIRTVAFRFSCHLKAVSKLINIYLKSSFFLVFTARQREGSTYHRLYLARYPAGFKISGEQREEKYGTIERAGHRYLVDVVSNGVIQALSYVNLLNFLIAGSEYKRLQSNGFVFLDRDFSFKDITKVVRLSAAITFLLHYSNCNRKPSSCPLHYNAFRELHRDDLHRSIISLPGNIFLILRFQRFLKANTVTQLVLYMHEYAYGRLLTTVARRHSVNVIGFQHGPYSPTRMVYYGNPGIDDLSRPQLVLAESDESRKAYIRLGHRKVIKMKKIPRLHYHECIRRLGGAGVIIVLGLHDDHHLLEEMINFVEKYYGQQPSLKLHPRSRLTLEPHHKKVRLILDKSIVEVLSIADVIVGTCSSVLDEAKVFGIPVHTFCLNGYIDESFNSK